jgi:predicted  nucleic acid-binding Zn-ribbon protein
MDVRTVYIDIDNAEDVGYQLGKLIEEMRKGVDEEAESLRTELEQLEKEQAKLMAEMEDLNTANAELERVIGLLEEKNADQVQEIAALSKELDELRAPKKRSEAKP